MKLLVAVVSAMLLTVACSEDDPPDYGLDHLAVALQDLIETPVPAPTLLGTAPGSLNEHDGQVIYWNGESMFAYEFPDIETARSAEDLFSDDASIVDGEVASWNATPHIFRKGRLLVIYDGDDRPTIDAIRRAMGVQFAGGHGPEQEPEDE